MEIGDGVNTDIVELNEEKSPQEELVEDMIAIVSFSARIYGKRGGRVAKKLTEMIEQEVIAGENHG